MRRTLGQKGRRPGTCWFAIVSSSAWQRHVYHAVLPSHAEVKQAVLLATMTGVGCCCLSVLFDIVLVANQLLVAQTSVETKFVVQNMIVLIGSQLRKLKPSCVLQGWVAV